MSPSDAKSDRQPTGRLSMTAPVGVDLEVADSRFRQVKTGPSPIVLDLAEGLYNLTWHAGGRSEDRMVRIRVGETTNEHGGEFPLGSAPPSAASAASRFEQSQFDDVEAAVSRARASGGAEILVVVRSSNDRPIADLARSVRLSDRNGERIPPAHPGSPGGKGQLDTRRYMVEPGPHVVGYEGSDRRRLEQTVQAIQGRQTIAYLKYGSLMITEQSPSGTGLKPRRGIDPTETTLVSVPLGRSGRQRLEEGSRLADIMLHKLAAGEPLRDEALLDLLKRKDADPFLCLYGAAMLVADRSETDRDQRRNDSLRLLERLEREMVPDAMCIRWKLQPGSALDEPLDFPPMLDACWRWAAEHSVLQPSAISQRPMLAAAARVTDPTPPWLVWLSGAKTVRRPASTDGSQAASTVAFLTRQIVDLVRVRASASMSHARERKIASLSPATVEYANAAMSVLSGADVPDEPEIARRIAYSTGTPSLELASQLGDALEELRGEGEG